jgi:hypothetical protein
MVKDIAMLYGEHGFTHKPKTSGELCGPCPWCGGKDRFTIFTGQGKDGLGRFWCRQCGKGGDAIQFLRDLDNLNFHDAKKALGLADIPGVSGRKAPVPPPKHQEFTPQEFRLPGSVWQTRSTKLVDWADEQLKQARPVQSWLAQERGIRLETAENARLGWIPQDFYRPRESFGLSPEYKENGKPKRVWIPKGLCIPVFRPGGIARIKIRLDAPTENQPRYIPLPQVEKCTAPLVLEKLPGASWQVVESELDALLLSQEAGHLVNVAALGSASYRPDTFTWEKLQAAPLVLVSLDFDSAGNKAACQWWKKHLPSGRVKLWPVPEGKDPCDSWRAG